MAKASDKLVLADKDNNVMARLSSERDGGTLIHTSDLFLQREFEPLVFDNIWDANRVRTSIASKVYRLDNEFNAAHVLNLKITTIKKLAKNHVAISKKEVYQYFDQFDTEHEVLRGGESKPRVQPPVMLLSENVPESPVEPRRDVPSRKRDTNPAPEIPIAPEMPPEPRYAPLTEAEQATASILSRALGNELDNL